MSDHYKPNLENNNGKVIALAGFAGIAIGLAFACNTKLVKDFLEPNLRPMFDNLLKTSSEKEEVAANLELIPDGKEQDVAHFINRLVKQFKPKRRYLQDKKSAKPHLAIVEAIQTAAHVLTRTK